LLILPSWNNTFTRRLEEKRLNEQETSRFLNNYYFQITLETLFPTPVLTFGILPEDSGEVFYYKVGVKK